jgi:hypothetical protein
MPARREHIVLPHRVLGVESQWATRAPWNAGVLIERDGRIWCSFAGDNQCEYLSQYELISSSNAKQS